MRQRGQALVELALVFTMLAVLVVGVLDFARVFYLDITATAAAMEAARASAAGLPDADVKAASVASAPAGLITPADVSIIPAQGPRSSLVTPVWTTATVTLKFRPFTPLAEHLIGRQVTLTRSVSERMRTPCALASGDAC